MRTGLELQVSWFPVQCSFCRKMFSLCLWASGTSHKMKGLTWLRGLISAQMCFVRLAWGCQVLQCESMGWVIKSLVWHRPCHSNSPFSVIYSVPVCMSLEPWAKGSLRSLPTLNTSDPESSPFMLFDSRQNFWWEQRIFWTDFVPFWQKYHPSNQRGVRNYKSLVISTQRGQNLTKGSLSLL